MKQIFKDTVLVNDRWQEVTCTKPLAVGHQGLDDEVVFWWAHDDTNDTAERTLFRVYGTGHVIPDDPDVEYVGTVQAPSGLVWHLFRKVGG